MSSRVDPGGLRRAVCGATALIPLMQTRPEYASRLILAALLCEPEADSAGSFRPHFGIVDRMPDDSALPESGPILACFVHAPSVAVSTLMRIVDHATAGWAGSDMVNVEDEPIEAPFEILLDGEYVKLAGNANVMHWHRGDARVPRQLASALMALEKFLYQKLDAGDDVDELLSELMTSRSVAVFGVLVEVACYKPALLRGPLAPLATSAALVLADRLYKARDHGYLSWTFGLGEQQRLRSWHDMPHRAKSLDQEIMRLAAADKQLADALAAGRDAWAQAPGNRWRFLIAQMDPANYVPAELDGGGRAWTFRMPESLQREVDADAQELESRTWWLAMPAQFASWLEADTQLTDVQARGLWEQVQFRLSEPPIDDLFADGVLCPEDIKCGAATVLLVCASSWTEGQADVMAFCREALLAPFINAPSTYVFDPAEPVDTSWDGFAAVGVPWLWQRNPDDPDLRACAAHLATHRHLRTVQRFFGTLAQQSALREDLRRLEVLSLHFARYSSWAQTRRHRSQQAKYWPAGPQADDLPDLRPQTDRIFNAFADGTLTTDSPLLAEFIAETPSGLVPAGTDPLDRVSSAIDISYFLSARVHLLSLPDGLPDEEQARRLSLAAQMASLFGRTLIVKKQHRQSSGVPNEDVRAMYMLLARMAVRAHPSAARPIWQPILAAGGMSEYVVSSFTSDVWEAGLSADPTPPGFAGLIKEMMSFAADQTSWKGRFSEELILALLCLSRFGHPRMKERHRSLLAALQPEWSDLAARQTRSSYSAQPLAAFLGSPAATDVVNAGLQWLAERERDGSPPDDDLDSQIAESLASLAGRDANILRKQPAAAELLAALVARQNLVALQLSAQVGRGT